jgi:hypothetical protein
MRKAIAVAACAVLAILPGSALAKPRAKVYRGTFQAVGADGAYTSGKFGKAQLVDGKRNDKLSVHVRHLGGHARYVFRLLQAPTACDESAPGGTEVAGWRYRRNGVLRTSRKGNANSWARSRSFAAQSGLEYFVGVYTATAAGGPGELVLCSELRSKGAKGGKHQPGKHPDKPGKHADKPRGHRGKPGKEKPAKPGKPADPGKPGEQRGGGGKPPHPHVIRAYRSALLR